MNGISAAAENLAVSCEVMVWEVCVHSAVSVCLKDLQNSDKNFQPAPPEQYLGRALGADKRLLNPNSLY